MFSKHLTDPDGFIRKRASQILNENSDSVFRVKNRITQKAIQKISTSLGVVNGKRRVRLLSTQEIINAIQTIRKRNYDIDVIHLHGGHVGNSYGYPASATIALILKVFNYIFLSIQLGRAQSGCTGYGRISAFLNSEEKRKDFIFYEATIILRLYKKSSSGKWIHKL